MVNLIVEVHFLVKSSPANISSNNSNMVSVSAAESIKTRLVDKIQL